MSEAISRRTFLKASAATAALAGGVCSFEAWRTQAQAEGAPSVEEVPSLCNGCSSKCGLVASVKDGRLWTLRGMEDHPYAKGTICGRGHGVAQIAYSDERVTTPLKKNAEGGFDPIDWDTAFAEIGERTTKIVEESGPEALALIHDPRPSGKYYGPRFMNALGCANVYTHGAACNLSNESGMSAAIGSSSYSVDFANAKMVVFIGRSYGDGIRPSSVQSLAAAAESDCKIVLVDPRLNNSAIFADQWIPIKPGYDLALLMGVANVLIAEGLYDKDFVEQSTVGFDEFAAQAEQYTPEWAEGLCDVPSDTIRQLARDLAEAAPAASIEPSWRAAFGCSYQNSFDTARAVAAINALLGSWGQKGGALITSSPKAGSLDKEKFPATPEPQAKRVGDAEYPLALSSMGSHVAAMKATEEGSIKGLFFYNSNAVQGYSNPKAWKSALEKSELSVAIDVQMSETALACDYVLPECSYLERMEAPEFIGGKKHYVAMRFPAIEKVHPETKSCDEIFTGLAQACGVGEYFQFTLEELAEAELATVGTSISEVKESGIVELADPNFSYGTPEFKTASGKFEFKNEKVGAAGLNPVIGYTPRLAEAKDGEFYLVGGKQGIHSHTMTQNIESLNAISREYSLERLWMNAEDAEAIGVEDGDAVEVSSSEHTATVAVKVTQRLKPGVLFLPSHYGGASSWQTRAFDYGINLANFVPVHIEPGVGSCMSQEVAVTVRKAGE